VRGGETSRFLALNVNISTTAADRSKLTINLLLTNRKSLSIGTKIADDDLGDDRKMTPWMTLKFELSVNFARFRRFGSEQRLNE